VPPHGYEFVTVDYWGTARSSVGNNVKRTDTLYLMKTKFEIPWVVTNLPVTGFPDSVGRGAAARYGGLPKKFGCYGRAYIEVDSSVDFLNKLEIGNARKFTADQFGHHFNIYWEDSLKSFFSKEETHYNQIEQVKEFLTPKISEKMKTAYDVRVTQIIIENTNY